MKKQLKDKLIGVKFLEKDAYLIKELATSRGQDISGFIRWCVQQELEETAMVGIIICPFCNKKFEIKGTLKW